MTSTQVSETESTSFVGQVKWFNNRLGYGFITIVSPGEHNGEDIFVHQQHITPKTSDYRSLQQGEYVSFQLGTADANSTAAAATENAGAKHVNQAVKVTGVFGGALMCDQIPRRVPTGTAARRPQSTTSQATPAATPATTPATTTPRRGAPSGRGGRNNNGRTRPTKSE